jgi:hypothetical protein
MSVSDAGAQFATLLSTPEPTQPPAVERPEPEQAPEAPDTKAEAGAEQAASEELPDNVDDLAKALGMEPDELASHLKIKVKVNGEERLVTLKEAAQGQQLEADYRRKTAELAEQRRQGETQIQAEIQQRVQRLDMLAQDFAANVLGAPPDPRLASEDPAQYVAAKAAYESNLYKLQQSRLEIQRLTQEQRASSIRANEAKIREAMPEWAKDEDKGRKEIGAIRQYLVKQGIPQQLADSVFEADHLLIARKAMLYDQLQTAKPDLTNKLRELPKVLRPGGVKPASKDNGQVVAALNRLKRTGSVKDAGAVFASMLKGK